VLTIVNKHTHKSLPLQKNYFLGYVTFKTLAGNALTFGLNGNLEELEIYHNTRPQEFLTHLMSSSNGLNKSSLCLADGDL
jgi:hypothetical protein